MNVTQPLREEHKELLPAIKDIGNLADSVYKLPQTELHEKLKTTLDFLEKELIPHALAENEVLYPKIDELIHSGKATETMRYDHQEIATLTQSLSENKDDKFRIQKLLHQLSILVMLHFKKEEEIFLPFLDENLNQKDAELLFREMELAAKKIKSKQK